MNDKKILNNYKYLKDIFYNEFDGLLKTFHGTHDVGTSFPRPRHGEQYLVRVYNLECCDDGKCIGGAVGAFEHNKRKETKGYYYIRIGDFEFQAESMYNLRERTVTVYYNACIAAFMKSVFFAPGIEKWVIELPEKKYYLESIENSCINLYDDAASQKPCERYDLFQAQSFRNFIFTILLLIPRLVGLCKITNMNRIGSFSSHMCNTRSLLLICILILKMGFYDEEFSGV